MAITAVHGKELRDLKVVKGTGLTIGICSGNYNISGIEGYYAGATNQAISASTTNYIELDNTGALHINTSGFTLGRLHIATVVTDVSSITTINDKRTFVNNGGAGLGTGIWNEGTPTGVIDGVNVTFTLPGAPDSGTLLLVLDGNVMNKGAGNDYTLSGNAITFLVAPAIGSKLVYFYTTSTPQSPTPAYEIKTASNLVTVSASAAPVAGYALLADDASNATWQINKAVALETATTTVDVSTSAAPTAGQGLSAVDGSNAQWSNPFPLIFNPITGTSFTAVANTGYVTNNASLCVGTLPATCAVGTFIAVQGLGAGGWRLTLNTGQNIIFNNASGTVTSGQLNSGNRYATAWLMCIVANTTFKVIFSEGTLSNT